MFDIVQLTDPRNTTTWRGLITGVYRRSSASVAAARARTDGPAVATTYSRTRFLIALIALVPQWAIGEPMSEIRIGAQYYEKGWIAETPIEVISKDLDRNRVKVFNPDSNEVYWVNPSDLVNWSGMVNRNVERAAVFFTILDEVAKSVSEPAPPKPDGSTAGSRSRWTPGEPHASKPNVVSGQRVGTWVPAAGYRWRSEDQRDRAIWNPGMAHPRHNNVQASATEGQWSPSPGYQWVDGGRTLAVDWQPGRVHPTNPGIVSSPNQDQWIRSSQWSAYKRTTAYLDSLGNPDGRAFLAPNSEGQLFATPDAMDIFSYYEFGPLYFFHLEPLDYEAISHFEYNYHRNWYWAVMKDGSRLDLGVDLEWQIQPHMRTGDVTVARTLDGKTQELILVPVRLFGGNHVVAPPPLTHRMGANLVEAESFVHGGRTFAGGARIDSLVDGFPAQVAGLQVDDVIYRVDEVLTPYPQDVVDYVGSRSTDEIAIYYSRAGRAGSVELVPQAVEGSIDPPPELSSNERRFAAQRRFDIVSTLYGIWKLDETAAVRVDSSVDEVVLPDDYMTGELVEIGDLDESLRFAGKWVIFSPGIYAPLSAVKSVFSRDTGRGRQF